jgi:transcriptional regulator with XRE-family HTH domain
MGRRIVVRDFVAQIGARVRFLRLERGLSQSELAELAGCSASCIMHFELGRRAVTIRILCKLARALDVQPFDILNHDTQTSHVGWFVETMRNDPQLVRFMMVKLEPRRRARAARARR